MQRTKANGLLYKQLCADSCKTRQGIADYMIIMRKNIEDDSYVKIASDGDKFYDYAGASMVDEPYAYKNEAERQRFYSINVWQRYASPVWFDIRQSRTLNTKQAKEDKDNKHICPLQLDVIERCIELWSNPDELVFSPFTGIGSEGYQAIKQGRKFVGSELKEAYFNVAVKNLKDAVKENVRLI
jgi:DNA modification methylase